MSRSKKHEFEIVGKPHIAHVTHGTVWLQYRQCSGSGACYIFRHTTKL